MSVDEIIKSLKELDLSTYPVDEIRRLLNSLGQAAHIVVSYHKGKSIIRVRPNSKYQKFNYIGKNGQIDHPIPVQIDHLLRLK